MQLAVLLMATHVQRQRRRQRLRAEQQTGQPIPPERFFPADDARGAEHRGWHIERLQHRQGRQQVVAIAVVESDHHGTTRASAAAELFGQLGQAHWPSPAAQHFHLRGKVLRRHAELPGVEVVLGDAVVHQDQRRRRHRVGESAPTPLKALPENVAGAGDHDLRARTVTMTGKHASFTVSLAASTSSTARPCRNAVAAKTLP